MNEKILVYYGKNPKGSSMYLVAEKLAQIFNCPMTHTLANITKPHLVIAIDLSLAVRAGKQKRYSAIKRVVLFSASNFTEYKEAELVSFAVHMNNKLVDGVILHSEESKSYLRSVLKKYLLPSFCKLTLDKTKVILWAIGDEFQYSIEGRLPTRWIAPFNRYQQSKVATVKPHSHRNVTELLVTRHNDTTCLLIKNSNLADFPEGFIDVYDVVEQGTREQYLDYIKDVGAFYCCSNSESFGIYYLELLMSGVVGVFLDYEWVRNLIPDYPLIVSESEVESAILDVRARLSYWQEKIKPSVDNMEHYRFSRFEREIEKEMLPYMPKQEAK